jgi:hypothetical protein
MGPTKKHHPSVAPPTTLTLACHEGLSQPCWNALFRLCWPQAPLGVVCFLLCLKADPVLWAGTGNT